MSYELQAFVGPEAHMTAVFSRYPGIETVGLRQGFSIAPISEQLFEIVHGGKPNREIADYNGEPLISKDTAEFGRLASRGGRLAYVNIGYNGGYGSQLAIAWGDGRIIFEMTVDRRPAPPGPDGAVNRALALMGAVAADGGDEFSALGLGLFRDTDEWLD